SRQETGGFLPYCLRGRPQRTRPSGGLVAGECATLERHIDAAAPLSADALSADTAYLPFLKNASVVCLSLVSTSSPARARFLVRRIRRRAPRAQILVGFWGSPAREVAAEEMARAISVQAVAFSLREAVGAIDSMLSMERAPANVT